MIPATYIIIGITAAISIWCFSNRELKYKLTFSPYAAKHHKRWYNVFTHAFVHADYIHLIFNLFVLYSFGYQKSPFGDYGLEADFLRFFGSLGTLWFVLLYIGGILFATLPAFYKHSENPNYLAVGASGAVSAVLFSSIIIHPFESLQFIFLPGVPIYFIVFGVLYLAYEIYMSKRGKDNIAHDAHFSGAIFGILFTLVIRPETLTELIEQIKLQFL